MDFDDTAADIHEQDPRLLLAIKGDQEALGSLLTSFMPKLYRTALRILHVPLEAEEAVQDGLVQVVKHFRGFRGNSRFSTWVTRVVINEALLRLRGRAQGTAISLDEPLAGRQPQWVGTIPDLAPDPEELCLRKECLQLLHSKLQSLPAHYRSVVWLRDVLGVSTKESADILGLKIGTLKSQLHRARVRLAREIRTARSEDRTPRTAPREWSEAHLFVAGAMEGIAELAA